MEIKCPNCDVDVEVVPSLLQIKQELTAHLLDKIMEGETTEEQMTAYLDELMETVNEAIGDAAIQGLKEVFRDRKAAAIKFKAAGK
jgi:hypothetical protein